MTDTNSNVQAEAAASDANKTAETPVVAEATVSTPTSEAKVEEKKV